MNGNGITGHRLALTASVSILAITFGATPRSASAQQAQPPQIAATDDSGVEEVVVTARKRSEKLIDVPVAVTALTAKDIEAEGVTSLSDVAQQTPGLTLDGTVGGTGRNDRSFPEYIIRGMVPSSAQNPTTTVFLDYAPIPSGEIDSIDDVERVEVLKGPQSAYFGRETFAGAINVVTKDPSDTFGGSVSGLVGSSDYTDFRGTLEGPIIPGILDVRVTLHEYARDGSYTNAAALTNAAGVQTKASADETLGDQSTKSASIEAMFKPFDNFKMKVIGLYWQDDDGPSAQALITPNQSNCTVEGVPYFCGTVPSLPAGTPAANTTVDAGVYGLLHNTKGEDTVGFFGGPSSMLFTPSDVLNHYGLGRDAYHISVAPEYAVPSLGFTIQSLTAVDKQVYAELQDLDNADTGQFPAILGPQAYYNWPFLVEDRYRNISQDLRVVSDADQPFRWTVGASYDWFRLDQGLLTGGPFGAGSYPYGSDEAQTIGGYFALAYDFLDNFTLNFEGRYQSDKQTAYNGDSNSVNVAATYRDFLPRVSLQYKFTPDVMTYATYSEGVNPGTFNTSEEGIPAALLPPGLTVEVKPEHLKNYELGVKGEFLDHKATLSADIYYDRWTDQIFLNEFTVITPGTGQADLLMAYSNANSSRLEGVEVDATVRPIPQVLINLSGAVNDSDIRSGGCAACNLGTGLASPSIIGNQLPNTSKYQAAVGVQYSDEITAMPGMDWFTRVDYAYKSGAYDFASNYVKTPESNRVNLRVGVETDDFRIEAFVENVTNDDAYTNLAPTAYLAKPTANDSITNTLVAGLPYLRTYGVRATYRFGEAPSPSPAPAVMPPPPPVAQPAPAPMPEKQREFQVFFDFDKSNITEAAARVIQAAADVVKSGGIAHITVTGHTDTVGTAKYNQGLSERRAASVKSALVTDGVDGGEVTTVGVGKSGLLVPTKDGVREPQNRRAVIELQ